jgi:hypothetical protein
MKRFSSSSRRLSSLTLLIGYALLFSVLPLSTNGQTRLTRGAVAPGADTARVESPSVSTSIVINEIYGGGGCGTPGCSTYGNDFIELKNIGTTGVNITGWSVQYKSATGITTTYAVTPLSGIIKAGDTFLIAEAAGAAGTGVNPLPAPNATGTIAMSATAGKIALVNTSTPLDATTCPPTAPGSTVIDFVGYGATASCFEGTGPAPAPSTTASVARNAAGLDTDQNATDFVSGAPTPQTAAFPTAASVSISGRVLYGERGVRNARVTISGGDLPDPITVLTGSKGQFAFNDIPAGRSYVVSVSARRFQFSTSSQVIEVNDNVAGVDFFAADGR